MYVGLAMDKHVPTITSDTLIVKADRMMEENRLWILLVLESGKLKGYVAKEDIRAALPSGATTFSKHELNYLLSRMTVKELVRGGMPTVTPETEIEVAAKIMHDRDLAGLAVVDKNERLKGYISRGSMLAVLVEEMGLELGGHRIAIEVEDRKGLMAEISRLFFDLGVNILSTSTFFRGNQRLLVFRVRTDDAEALQRVLTDKGYRIAGPERFEQEWA
ncbi:MAG: CBS domain-containing protein [Desulfomicrobium sp.]|nr:CBS domain-containing protein [Pseudomonadota bacterium]MBV1710734.1 CBS domain-containing protein [Desulfomicrobium sp.]MBU4570342.1 CBS domain-containing protein [Pseudomonadota bacterium]MBU4593263.1 CBS domain-containing protein [Pseudomonadota bacterium]MBV1719816.1 CBS domain-containing protein [Desulfomicrobium sp.]